MKLSLRGLLVTLAVLMSTMFASSTAYAVDPLPPVPPTLEGEAHYPPPPSVETPWSNSDQVPAPVNPPVIEGPPVSATGTDAKADSEELPEATVNPEPADADLVEAEQENSTIPDEMMVFTFVIGGIAIVSFLVTYLILRLKRRKDILQQMEVDDHVRAKVVLHQ